MWIQERLRLQKEFYSEAGEIYSPDQLMREQQRVTG